MNHVRFDVRCDDETMKLNVKHIPCNRILHRLLLCLVTGRMGWMINFIKDKDTERIFTVDHLSPWLIKAYEKAKKHRKRFLFSVAGN